MNYPKYTALTGKMNLKGSRAERPVIYQDLENLILKYSSKYLIWTGLRVSAQVYCPYKASIEDSVQKLSYDIFYLSNFSIDQIF